MYLSSSFMVVSPLAFVFSAENFSHKYPGWWFQIVFIFTPTWGNDPIRLIFFRWVETTNQNTSRTVKHCVKVKVRRAAIQALGRAAPAGSKRWKNLTEPWWVIWRRYGKTTDLGPKACTRWWFQTFFFFIPIWGRFPFWLIFFKWVETTNQCNIGKTNIIILVGVVYSSLWSTVTVHHVTLVDSAA